MSQLRALTVRQLSLLPFPKVVLAVPKPAAGDAAGVAALTWTDTRAAGLLTAAPETALTAAAAHPEGYGVFAWREGQTLRHCIIADTPRARCYAQVTTAQLRQRHPVESLPAALLIVDWPDVPVRMALRTLFCTRDTEKRWYFEDGLQNVRDIFRRMTELKLNTFGIHCEWGFGVAELLPDGERLAPFIVELMTAAQEEQIDVCLLLAHSLELDRQNKPAGRQPCACGSDPANRAERRRVFTHLVRSLPQVRRWMIHNDEHPRCTCDRCRQTPFIDEFISHLQDYRAILRAERPEAVLVAVPFYQLGWPKAQFSFLDGRWREVSDDLRVCWWTENYPLHPLPQFLTKVEEAFEPVVFDKHPHVWHWFYMNGWSDFVFPCPEHFRSWVRRGLASGHVEAFSGESAFYRGVEWNMRALSQYTWNCELRTHDFDTLMLRSTYGNAAVAAARPLLRGYRRILSRFLTDLFQKAHRWKEAPDGAWVRTLHAVVNETQRLELDFRLHVTPARNAPGDPAYDFLLDLAILRHEAELRLHLRDGFLAWRDAEKDYARGKAEIGEACLLRSMDRIRDAQRAWFELRDARRARGVWYDQFQAAPMTKLERVFPDLLETSELTLRLRRQGYRGYRPRWKEWIEIHQWPWQEYVAFH